jgi:hypothetical protein
MVESCMDFSVSSWFVFYLECDKGNESSSYQTYIEVCYSYVLVFFFYKIRILEYVCPISITSMASSICWFVHLPRLDALGCLLVVVELCTIIMTRWIVVALLWLVADVDSLMLLGW